MSRILVLGGTRFLGPHLSRAALAGDHELTLFHRGNSPIPDGIVGAREVHGDRFDADALARLARGHWDAVIDTSCYVPRAARLAVDALDAHADRYVLVSSVSVYASSAPPFVQETAALEQLADETQEDVTGERHGGLKALCEVEVMSRLAGRAVVVRPTIVAGPGDPTDRFTYWCRRIAAGGDVLAPGPQDLPVQYIDVRDLTTWILHMSLGEDAGVYNAAGPAEPLGIGRLLEGIREALGSSSRLEWIPADFLLAHGVEPWSDLPLWVPASIRNVTADTRRAVAAGLVCRPLRETVLDTLSWAQDRARPGLDGPPGLSPAREAQLLDLWRQSRGPATG